MTPLSNFRFNTLFIFGLLLPLAAIALFSGVSYADSESNNPLSSYGSMQQTPALAASAVPNTSDWISGFYLPGTNGIVHATALDSNGHLYIGGQFSVVGDIDAMNIARWDGTKWHAVGTGTSGAVYALTVGSNDTLYAGGTFTSAGSCTTNCKWLAAWNGTDWSALGTGLDGLPSSAVRALAINNDGQLYVGGSFAVAGSCVTCTSVARWNGTTWSPLNQGTPGTVYALAADGTGNVYVGGNFFSVDGCNGCQAIGRWNGTSWNSLETGVSGTVVYALAIDSNHNVYVGGDFFAAGNSCSECFQIGKWNGTTWSDIGYDPAFTNQVTELALNASGTLYVYGEASADFGDMFRWNGANWNKLTDYPIDVNTLVINSSGKVYIGGGFGNIGDCFSGCASIVQLSGNTWNPVGPFGRGPAEFVTSLLTDQNGDVIVAGYFDRAGACTTCSGIARWNGSNWSPLGQPPFIPSAMVLDSNGNLYIAQSWQSVFMWNGTDWSSLGDDFIGGTPYDMIVDGNDTLYIAGNFIMASCFPDCINITQWDGMAWLGLDWGILDPVHTLAVDSNNNLYAGGEFVSIFGNTTDCADCNYIAKWNGTSWTSLASTPNNTVRTLVFDSDDMLYAGGDFTVAGTCFSNCQRIAMWNGSAWSGLGGGMNNRVQTLAIDANGALYAGGTFTTAGTCTSGCTFIAGWDGSTWHDLDNGMDGEVTALAINRQGLVHAAGYFSHAGDKISRYFAAQSPRLFLPFIVIAE